MSQQGRIADLAARVAMGNVTIDGAAVHDYKQIAGRSLRMHVLDGRPDRTRPAGGVVMFHGGGWVTGSPKFVEGHARALADLGVVVALAEYRVRSVDETGVAEAVADGRSAMRWFRSHAASLGVDPDRIAAAGSSAGAHLALMTALGDGIDDAGDDLGVPCRPAAIVAWSTPADLTQLPVAQANEGVEKLSPLQNLGPSLPPTVLLHARSDELCSFGACERLAVAARDAQLPLELIAYDGDHVFHRPERHPDAFRSTIDHAVTLLRQVGVVAS